MGLPGQSKTSGGSGGAKRESKNFFAFTFAPTETGSGETEYDHEFDEPQRLTRYYFLHIYGQMHIFFFMHSLFRITVLFLIPLCLLLLLAMEFYNCF